MCLPTKCLHSYTDKPTKIILLELKTTGHTSNSLKLVQNKTCLLKYIISKFEC